MRLGIGAKRIEVIRMQTEIVLSQMEQNATQYVRRAWLYA